MRVGTQTKVFFLVYITTVRGLLVRNSCVQVPVILSDKQEEEYQKALHKRVFPAELSVSCLPSPLAAIDGTNLSNLTKVQ